MNTGIISILMHQLPYQFYGLRIISSVLFVFNIILFTVFFIVFGLRCLLYPSLVVNLCKTNPLELSMLGAIPIAWFTLCAQVGVTVSNATWGGHGFFLAAYVMWWAGTLVMGVVAVTVIIVFSKTNVLTSETVPPALVLPFVGTTTDAVAGALIVTDSANVNSRLAIPIIIFSYIFTGLGFWAAVLIYAAYFVRLMNHGLPPAEMTPSLVILVGPSGQTAAAVQLLGIAARQHFGAYGRGTFLQANAGEICATMGTLLGLFFLGLGLLFASFCLYVILEVAFKKQHKYSLVWWSTIFPVATVNTVWISFAEEMDSPIFRVLAAGTLIFLFVDYLINWVFTLRDIWTGKLLGASRPVQNGRQKAS